MNELLYSANAIPITPSNKLRLAFWSSGAESGFNVVCRYQIQNKDGSISQNVEIFAVIASAINQQFFINLAYGNLIAVTLATFDTTIQNGQIYATISLQYGNVNDNNQQLPLISGYVLANAPLNYPLSQTKAINSGLPAIVEVAVADPNAGTDWTHAEVGTSRSLIRNGQFTFVADATVANRTIQMAWSNASSEVFLSQLANPITASQTIKIILSRTPLPLTVPTNVQYMPVPDISPQQTLNLTSITTNIQAGDQYENIDLVAERYVAM